MPNYSQKALLDVMLLLAIMSAVPDKRMELYARELHSLAGSVVRRCDALFASRPVETVGHTLRGTTRDDHDAINVILLGASNIAKLLSPPVEAVVKRDGTLSRTHAEIAMHRRRYDWLRTIIPKVPVALMDRKVRNTVEHFDERLDNLNVKIEEGTLGADWVTFDIDLSNANATRTQSGLPVVQIRGYLAEEPTYCSFGERIDLDAIRNECLAIGAAISVSVHPDLLAEGGWMYPVPVTRRPG
jgi:hypothetical protein